jgi:hypothetical protein
MTLLDGKGQELYKVSKYETFDLSELKNESKSEIFEVASKGQIYYGEFSLTQHNVPTMMIAVPIKEYKKESFAVLSAKILGNGGRSGKIRGERGQFYHSKTFPI